MAKAKPEKSCNDTVFKYVIEQKDVDAAKRQVIRVAGDNPVIFVENALPNNQIELMVVGASLTASQKKELDGLQADGAMTRKIAHAQFEANEISFNMFKK